MAKEEKTEKLKNRRANIIEMMKRAVKDKPEKFDPNRLQQAIDELNIVPDENLDAYLVLGNHLNILLRQISFTENEVEQVRAVFKEMNCNVELESHFGHNDRSRDSWSWKLRTPNGNPYAVLIVKTNSSAPYALHACGTVGPGSICNYGHAGHDELVKHIRRIIDNDIAKGN